MNTLEEYLEIKTNDKEFYIKNNKVIDFNVSNDKFFECVSNDVDIVFNVLNISPNKSGYKYFKEAIFIYMTNQNTEKLSMTKQVYPIIAKKFETTSSRVERALRHAIEVAWSRGDIDIQNEIFGYTIDPKKGHPTNSEAVATIADYLKRN